MMSQITKSNLCRRRRVFGKEHICSGFTVSFLSRGFSRSILKNLITAWLGLILNRYRRLFASMALGEQTYVTRYDIFAGYARFESPKVNLSEKGSTFKLESGHQNGIPSVSITAMFPET